MRAQGVSAAALNSTGDTIRHRTMVLRYFGGGQRCAGGGCPAELEVGQEAVLDLSTGHLYCAGCGKALRYARKRAAQRGEPEPLGTEG